MRRFRRLNEEVELMPADYQPKKVGKAYKVFYLKNGKLYPPMVANKGGSDTPIGVWLKAQVAEMAPPSKTGRPQVRGGGKGTRAGKLSLAFRPGWHLGDIPLAKQFLKKDGTWPKDLVWAECDYAMDIDYQDEANAQGINKNGKYQHSLAGLKKVPENGYYKYRTNPNPDTVPWVITGAMKINRILTDNEVADILISAGVEPPKRESDMKESYELRVYIGDEHVYSDDAFTSKESAEQEVSELKHYLMNSGYADDIDLLRYEIEDVTDLEESSDITNIYAQDYYLEDNELYDLDNVWVDDEDDITLDENLSIMSRSKVNVYTEDIDDIYDELEDEASIAYTYYNYLPNSLYNDVATGYVDISNGAMTEDSLEAILNKGEYTEEEKEFLRGQLGVETKESDIDSTLKESTHRSGNRYLGGLPSEPAASEYARALKNVNNKRKQFMIDNRVEEIDGPDRQKTYKWSKDGHTFEMTTKPTHDYKTYTSKLVVDGRDIDPYSNLKHFQRMNYPDIADFNFNHGYFRFKDESDSLDEDIEKHSELNPDLFDENKKLKSEVREKIEDIIDHFKQNLKEDNIELEIKDIVLVGSNASFNYTDHSDIDVHIIADTSIYKDKSDLAAKLYEAYKRLFNNKYDPTIRGHEVEIYVDADEDKSRSNGVYSIMNNDWKKIPESTEIPEVNMDEINIGIEPYINKFNKIETVEDADKLLDDIYLVRQTGILNDGEYSLGNLIFKEFRNLGYLDKLKAKKVELENKEMSLEEGKFKDTFKNLNNKVDNAMFNKTTKTQVNFSDYENEIGEIIDQYDDVIDAAHAALEYLVYKAKDPYAIKLASTDKGYNNLMDYLEKIAKYEGVGKRQLNKEVDDFKRHIKNTVFEDNLKEDVDYDKALKNAFNALDDQGIEDALRSNKKLFKEYQLISIKNPDTSVSYRLGLLDKPLNEDLGVKGDREIEPGINWVWFTSNSKDDASKWFEELTGSAPTYDWIVSEMRDERFGFRIHIDNINDLLGKENLKEELSETDQELLELNSDIKVIDPDYVYEYHNGTIEVDRDSNFDVTLWIGNNEDEKDIHIGTFESLEDAVLAIDKYEDEHSWEQDDFLKELEYESRRR